MNSYEINSMAAFHRKAQSYDEHAIVQKDAAAWLAEWLPETSHPGRCLELGAGTGIFTEYLPGRFEHLEVSDASDKMLEVCNQRVPGIPQSTRDAWSKANDPSNWDYLTSSSLLQWAPDPIDCLQNWKAMLKRNGRILLGFFAEPSLPEMIDILDGKSPIDWYKKSAWQKHFTQSGLTVERIEIDTRQYTYESPLHFWKSLHGTGATVSQRLAPSQMLKLFREYEKSYAHADGGVYATWTFCRAELSLDN